MWSQAPLVVLPGPYTSMTYKVKQLQKLLHSAVRLKCSASPSISSGRQILEDNVQGQTHTTFYVHSPTHCKAVVPTHGYPHPTKMSFQLDILYLLKCWHENSMLLTEPCSLA